MDRVLRSDSEVMVGLRQVTESFDGENRRLEGEGRMLDAEVECSLFRKKDGKKCLFPIAKDLKRESRISEPRV